jgi:hypothetical protein
MNEPKQGQFLNSFLEFKESEDYDFRKKQYAFEQSPI